MEFPPTEWSLIVRAAESGGSGSAALEKLCRDYWRPVHGFLRTRGWTAEAAEDATQEFFQHLLTTRAWRRAERDKGRFRTFLLGVLMRVLSRERDRANAGKRGGGRALLSLDAMEEDGDERSLAGADDGAAARQFDQEWAVHVMESALTSVATEWAAREREDDLAKLIGFLPTGGGVPPDYATVAGEMGISFTAIRSAVSRLRSQFREAVQREIARTVTAPHEITDEMRHLCAVMLDPEFQSKWRATSGGLSAENPRE